VIGRLDVAISLDAIGIPSIWNVETGKVVALQSHDYDGQRTRFELTFQPCESYLIGVSSLPVGEEIVEIEHEPRYSKVIQLADQWEFSTDKPNALPLSMWQFSMGNPANRQWPEAGTSIRRIRMRSRAQHRAFGRRRAPNREDMAAVIRNSCRHQTEWRNNIGL